MATKEINSLLAAKDDNGDLNIVYPITKKENISNLTESNETESGLMSAYTTKKLNGIEEQATKTIINIVRWS